MSRPSRPLQGSLLAGSGLVALLVFGLVAYASGINGNAAVGRPTQPPQIPPGDSVRMSGHVAGLYPGGTRSFRVAVENVGRRPLLVHSVGALVKNPSRSCSAASIRLSSFRGRLRLAPGSRRRVRLGIAMLPDAANACQRATFPLVYRARVTPVR
jgi:hypothetical protein